MTRRLRLGFLLGLVLLLSMAAQSGKSYSADRFDVDIIAQRDRSLLVRETVVFRFQGGPFSFVFRELPTDHTDGITGIVAGVDGEPWPEGTGPGQVEITGNDPIVVTWHLSPTADTVQSFTLSYQALGVVRQTQASDVLDWQALPDEYDYDIAASRVTVSYPADMMQLTAPEVLTGKADTTADDGQAIFTQGNLSSGNPLVIRLNFAPGSFSNEPPLWQMEQAAQNSYAWIWFVAAAIVLLGGLAAFIRAARPYSRSVPKATIYLYKPPLELSPALAGYLADTAVGWQHGLATLFELAARGLIEIEQTREKSAFRSPEFDVTLLERPEGLKFHEQALLDLLFTDKKGVEHNVITLSEIGKLVTSSRWQQFTDVLRDEADLEGLTDDNAKARGKQIIGWGAALLIVSLLLVLPTFLLRGTFGAWPLVAVASVALVGLVGILVGAGMSPLSEKGYAYATAFEPFRQLLKDVATDKTNLPDPTYYETYLPYAAAYGIAEPWVKEQAKSDYQQLPAYFRAAANAEGMGAFVAVISAASHSGGAAASAGAAAAGGGASGAG